MNNVNNNKELLQSILDNNNHKLDFKLNKMLSSLKECNNDNIDIINSNFNEKLNNLSLEIKNEIIKQM